MEKRQEMEQIGPSKSLDVAERGVQPLPWHRREKSAKWKQDQQRMQQNASRKRKAREKAAKQSRRINRARA